MHRNLLELGLLFLAVPLGILGGTFGVTGLPGTCHCLVRPQPSQPTGAA